MEKITIKGYLKNSILFDENSDNKYVIYWQSHIPLKGYYLITKCINSNLYYVINSIKIT